jgi:hypothetical protein
MQVGIVVTGFAVVDGLLVLCFTATIVRNGRAATLSGTAPFGADEAAIKQAARAEFIAQFGVTPPANATVRVIPPGLVAV